VGVCQSKQLILEPDPGEKTEPMLFRVPLETYREIAARDSVPVRYDGRPYRAAVITVRIDETLCRGCGVCEEICDYKAIRIAYQREGIFVARVEEQMCRGCGACVSICPTGAIEQGFFSGERIMGRLEEVLKPETLELPVLMLAWRWSGILQILPAERRGKVIELMCLGRLAAGDLLRAFELGAAGVLILGCAKEQCHYGFGGRVAEGNLQRLSALLELLGIPPDRLRFLGSTEAGSEELALEVEAFIKGLSSQEAGSTGRL